MSIGIATLARNSAHLLPDALTPFLGKVDRVAVLLGGQSTDNTPEIARRFADVVSEYDGPLDDNGGLLDFGSARQQSFDLLDTDWILAVDTDDRWTGADQIGAVVSDAAGCDAVLFPYDLGGGVRFLQSRLFKRDSGYWSSPVHEQWIYHNQPNVKTRTVNAMTVNQVAVKNKMDSVWRNIRIAEAYIAKNGFNYRLLMHLPHEYIITKQYSKSIEAVNQVLDRRGELTDELIPERLFGLYYTLAMAHLCLEEYEAAAGAMLQGLACANYGNGWTMLAQIAYQMGVHDLAVVAAERALDLGHPVDVVPTPFGNISSVPYYIKAQALAEMGRKYEAITAINLGLAFKADRQMQDFKNRLCEELGVIP